MSDLTEVGSKEWRELEEYNAHMSRELELKLQFHDWMHRMWEAGHMPVEIRDIWLQVYIGEAPDTA